MKEEMRVGKEAENVMWINRLKGTKKNEYYTFLNDKQKQKDEFSTRKCGLILNFPQSSSKPKE